MAESRANKVPRSAFGFFSSWKDGKMRSENVGASRTLVLGKWGMSVEAVKFGMWKF